MKTILLLEDKKTEARPQIDYDQTLKRLAQNINCHHHKGDKAEQTALLEAWNAGQFLEEAWQFIADHNHGSVYGSWGNFLNEYCPDLSRETVRKYRLIAGHFQSSCEFDGMTLSEAYAEIKLLKWKKEQVEDQHQQATHKEEEDSFEEGELADENEEDTIGAKPTTEKPKHSCYAEKMFRAIAAIADKFSTPEQLTLQDYKLIRRGGLTLAQVLSGSRKHKPAPEMPVPEEEATFVEVKVISSTFSPTAEERAVESVEETATAALVTLGYKKTAAQNYVRQVLDDNPNAMVEQVIKTVLANYKRK